MSPCVAFKKYVFLMSMGINEYGNLSQAPPGDLVKARDGHLCILSLLARYGAQPLIVPRNIILRLGGLLQA